MYDIPAASCAQSPPLYGLPQVTALDSSRSAQIQARIDQKTKPAGALGQLEALALQLALVQQRDHLAIERPLMLVVTGYPAADARVPHLRRKPLDEIATFR